jgi:hypothetical protein
MEFNTVDENTIATIKVRNNFCYHLEMVDFSLLLPHLAIALLVALNLFASNFV